MSYLIITILIMALALGSSEYISIKIDKYTKPSVKSAIKVCTNCNTVHNRYNGTCPQCGSKLHEI